MLNVIEKTFHFALIFVLFLIPLAWSTEVNANYFTTKSFLIYLSAGLASAYIFFRPDRAAPKLSKKILGIAAFFVAVQLLYPLFFGFPASFIYLPEFLVFGSLIFYFYQSAPGGADFFKTFDGPLAAFFLVAISLSLENVWQTLQNPDPLAYVNLIVPFGNVNMLAEFYLLCLPLVFEWIFNPSKIFRWFKVAVLTILCGLVLYARSRSAFFGLGLGTLALIYFQFPRCRKVFLGLGGLILLLSSVFVFIKPGYISPNDKSYSTQERLNYYRSAVDFIVDHPFGTGSSEYVNAIVPYRMAYAAGPHEEVYPDQPHSEILKWGIQFGWAGILLAVSLLIIIARQFYKRGSRLLWVAYFCLIPELIFQFPFENPATLLLLALYGTFFLQLFEKINMTKNQLWIKRAAAGIGSLFLMYFSVVYVVSIYFESRHVNSVSKMTWACEMNPAYLRGCVARNYALFERVKDEPSARAFLGAIRHDMERHYFLADNLRLLARYFQTEVYVRLASRKVAFENTCEVIGMYAIIYREQTYFPAEDVAACNNIKAPVEFRNPMQFNGDYQIWIANLLK